MGPTEEIDEVIAESLRRLPTTRISRSGMLKRTTGSVTSRFGIWFRDADLTVPSMIQHKSAWKYQCPNRRIAEQGVSAAIR